MQKYNISAIVPCYNESHNIEEVLQSVNFCNEVILVDSQSTDNTVELARPFIDRLLVRDYEHSASQKNWAIPQASNEWILLVDADERVTPALKEEILELFERIEEEPHVGYWIGRLNLFMGKQVRYSGWKNDKVIRFFRKSKCRYEDKQVHSEIIADGTIGYLTNKLTHYKYNGIDAHMRKLQRYAGHQAIDYNDKIGRITAFHVILKPFWSFLKHYFIQLGFMDGFVGLVIAYLRGYMVFMRYVKLWLYRRNLE